MGHFFFRLAHFSSWAMGHPTTFAVSLVLAILWGASGPLMGYSDTWQLIINTFTSIVTYLVIFLIQHTQNHDTAALHAKLDELITHLEGPRDGMAGIELHERIDRDAAPTSAASDRA